jgi:hypothetical protein
VWRAEDMLTVSFTVVIVVRTVFAVADFVVGERH